MLIEEIRKNVIEKVHSFEDKELLSDFKKDIELYVLNTNKPSLALAVFSETCHHVLGQNGNVEKDQDYISVIEGLIELGADPDSYTCGRANSSLFSEAQKGNAAVVKILLDHGALADSKNSRDSYFKSTPLMLASKNGHEAIINLLLESGANVNRRDITYSRAIDYAKIYNQPKVVELLMKKGSVPPRHKQAETWFIYPAPSRPPQAIIEKITERLHL